MSHKNFLIVALLLVPSTAVFWWTGPEVSTGPGIVPTQPTNGTCSNDNLADVLNSHVLIPEGEHFSNYLAESPQVVAPTADAPDYSLLLGFLRSRPVAPAATAGSTPTTTTTTSRAGLDDEDDHMLGEPEDLMDAPPQAAVPAVADEAAAAAADEDPLMAALAAAIAEGGESPSLSLDDAKMATKGFHLRSLNALQFHRGRSQ